MLSSTRHCFTLQKEPSVHAEQEGGKAPELVWTVFGKRRNAPSGNRNPRLIAHSLITGNDCVRAHTHTHTTHTHTTQTRTHTVNCCTQIRRWPSHCFWRTNCYYTCKACSVRNYSMHRSRVSHAVPNVDNVWRVRSVLPLGDSQIIALHQILVWIFKFSTKVVYRNWYAY